MMLDPALIICQNRKWLRTTMQIYNMLYICMHYSTVASSIKFDLLIIMFMHSDNKRAYDEARIGFSNYAQQVPLIYQETKLQLLNRRVCLVNRYHTRGHCFGDWRNKLYWSKRQKPFSHTPAQRLLAELTSNFWKPGPPVAVKQSRILLYILMGFQTFTYLRNVFSRSFLKTLWV